MDRNGYNPSIMATTERVCYLCKAQGQTIRHEVFYGVGERTLSKRYGLWVNICTACHSEVHADYEGEKAETLRRDAEAAFIAQGYPRSEFIRIFVKGYIKHWEIK